MHSLHNSNAAKKQHNVIKASGDCKIPQAAKSSLAWNSFCRVPLQHIINGRRTIYGWRTYYVMKPKLKTMSDLNRATLVLYRARYGAPRRSVHSVDWWCFTSSRQTAQGWPHTASSHVKCEVFKAGSGWLLAAALLPSSPFPRNPSSEISHKLVPRWTKSRKTHSLSARIWRVERQQDRAARIRTDRWTQVPADPAVSVALSGALWSCVRINQLWLKQAEILNFSKKL